MSAFVALAADAVRDSLRRRSLLAAGAVSVLVALAVNRCTGCETTVVMRGETLRGGDLAVLTSVASVVLLALWTYSLAALLASDGLASALEDGTAESVLARPLSRDRLCLARLAGALAGALSVGLPLLAFGALLLHVRQGLEPAAAAAVAFAIVLGAWSSAALAMALSLALPRPATLLSMAALGAVLCGVDLATWLSGEAAGVWGLAGRLGPAWLSSPLLPLAGWLAPFQVPPPPRFALLRAAGWALAATGALVVAFRRRELPR